MIDAHAMISQPIYGTDRRNVIIATIIRAIASAIIIIIITIIISATFIPRSIPKCQLGTRRNIPQSFGRGTKVMRNGTGAG